MFSSIMFLYSTGIDPYLGVSGAIYGRGSKVSAVSPVVPRKSPGRWTTDHQEAPELLKL